MKNSMKTILAGVTALSVMGGIVSAATYAIDKSHAHVGFSVRHMVVSNTKGKFNEFDGTIEFDKEAPENIRASATVEVASIDTDNEKRDNHLRDPDFFDVDTYPQITFETTSVKGDYPEITLVGDLTIKDVTKEVEIPTEFMGPITDPWGNERIGFSGETTINRQDFNIAFSKLMEGGGLVVGDKVKIILEIEAIKQ